jgi:formylglycine-generating enzyme required for sulfatase activity
MRLRKSEMTGGVMRGQSVTAIRAARGMLPAVLACLCMTFGGVAHAQKVTTVNGWERAEYTDEISDQKSFWVARKISSGFSGELSLKCDRVDSDIYGMVLFGPFAARVGDDDTVTLRFDGGQPVVLDGRHQSSGRTNFTTTLELLDLFKVSSKLVVRVANRSLIGTETQTGTVSLSGSTSAIDWLEQKCGFRAKREAAAAVAAAALQRVRALEQNMIRVPGGTFLMGSPPAERERSADEGPQRSITIQPFEVSKHEVTWAEYDACVSVGSCPAALDDRFGKGDRPVTNVSWDDASKFVTWLSRETGKTYRLLSEAEWEYAARAGTTTAYSLGDSISNSQANYSGGLGKTTPVGTFPANSFGLHDMHGNVWEWVEDCYAENYSAGQPSDGRAYTSGSCSARVGRGGSWNSVPHSLRSAYRNVYPPTFRGNDLGFRVAGTLSSTP